MPASDARAPSATRGDDASVTRYTDLALYRRLLARGAPVLAAHRRASSSLSLLATPLALLAPVPLAIAVDSVIGSQPLPGFLDAILPARSSDSQTGDPGLRGRAVRR